MRENYDNEEDSSKKKIMEMEVPSRISKGIKIGAGVLAAAWLSTGFYFVDPKEEGVVTQFGKYISTTNSGLNFKIPWPIQEVSVPEVTKVRRLEIGFRTIDQETSQFEDKLEEALMLTGDENIVDLESIVQYKITNSRDYLFNCDDVEGTLRDASEASIRQIVGDHGIDKVLTTGKGEIQEKIRTNLQGIMNNYRCGVNIVAVQLQDVDPPAQVASAFQDVASAREDRDKSINEAKGYANDIIPKARGSAAKLIKDAEAYKERRIKEASGDAQRFVEVLTEYSKAPDVTATRMYLETMTKVLPNLDIVVTGPNNSIVPLLGLNKSSLGLEEVLRK